MKARFSKAFRKAGQEIPAAVPDPTAPAPGLSVPCCNVQTHLFLVAVSAAPKAAPLLNSKYHKRFDEEATDATVASPPRPAPEAPSASDALAKVDASHTIATADAPKPKKSKKHKEKIAQPVPVPTAEEATPLAQVSDYSPSVPTPSTDTPPVSVQVKKKHKEHKHNAAVNPAQSAPALVCTAEADPTEAPAKPKHRKHKHAGCEGSNSAQPLKPASPSPAPVAAGDPSTTVTVPCKHKRDKCAAEKQEKRKKDASE